MRRATRFYSTLALVGLVCLLAGPGARAATTYYFDYASGNDANNGLSTAAPKKRHFYMKGYSGTAYTHAAGDTFVFKGGVSWPVANFQMLITAGGSGAGTRDTYKADTSWYTGGSFTRPVFDFQHTAVGQGWTYAAGVLVQGANYITFDNLELKNFRAPLEQNGISLWGTTTICLNEASNITCTNLYIHDWDQPTVGGTSPNGTAGGGAIMRVNNGVNNVITHCTFDQLNVAVKGGSTISWNIPQIDNCVAHDFAGSFYMYGQLMFNNHVYNITDPADQAAHSNVALCPGGLTATNNLIHDIQGRAQILFTAPGFSGAGADLLANNVVYNVAQPPIAIDTDGANNPGAVSRVYNNTLVAPNGVGPCIRIGYRANGPFGTFDGKNNHYVNDGSDPVLHNNPSGGGAYVTSYSDLSYLQQSLQAANAAGYTAGNNYAPLDETKPSVVAGIDVSAYLTTDILGNPRPSTAGLWNLGAYAFVPTTGVPGTLVLSTASGTVAEDGGSITITAKRTGGSTGAVSASYGTAAGTATPGVNYTTTMGTFNWSNGDTANKTVAVPILNVPFYGSKQFTVTINAPTGGATIGTPATETVTINGVGSAPINLLSGLVWTSASDVAPPMTRTGSYYSQSIETLDPANSGVLNYYFTNAAGTYAIYCVVDAPSDNANSFFVRVNGVPVSPDNIFDVVTLTSGPEERAVSARGPTGTFDMPATNVIQVDLAAGVTNWFQWRAREANAKLYQVEARLLTPPPPVVPASILSVTITNVDGYYKAGVAIAFDILFSTNVTVTGTPTLTLNSGGTASYASGSGTDTLRFAYIVAGLQNTQTLDYSSTSALSGGSIKNDSTLATLTLPSPGTPGSASYQRSVVIDTTPPVVSISAPSASLTPVGGTVFYTITYTDTNFAANTLVAGDVTVNGSTTATVSVGPNNVFNVASVTLSSLTVGTGSISLASGTAYDLAGNLAVAAGPSAGFTVSSAFGGTANVITTKAGIVISNP